MGISFRDFIESDNHLSFQVFVESVDEDIALLETVMSLDGYHDHINMLKCVARRFQYPAQEFFRYVGTVNGIKHYETAGRSSAKCFEESYMQSDYKPFMFQEVIEYYAGDADLRHNDGYDISDLIEV